MRSVAVPAASRVKSATSVATWSLRRRAVCSFPPGGPASSVTPPLDRHVDVLVVGEEREAPLRELRLDLVERPSSASRSAPEMIPAPASIRAWARDWRTSCGQRRRSKPSEVLSSAEDRVLGLGEAAQAPASVSFASSSSLSSSPAIGRICASCSVLRALAIGVDDRRAAPPARPARPRRRGTSWAPGDLPRRHPARPSRDRSRSRRSARHAGMSTLWPGRYLPVRNPWRPRSTAPSPSAALPRPARAWTRTRAPAGCSAAGAPRTSRSPRARTSRSPRRGARG